ncbi:MAG: ATP synthase F1 subunit gamma [Lachnospiraceae bacterium]|nr:ATP synthase F1 subunit gamma [Lachnospiraceae bacterium]
MASMRDIKRRRSSISSTQQITKAMKLVSTVKLQKAKGRAEDVSPYFDAMYKTVCSMIAGVQKDSHPFLAAREDGKKLIITITSNRGLAGGYNSNVVRMITASGLAKEDVEIFAIGRKGEELLAHRGYDVVTAENDVMEAPTYEDASRITKEILKRFSEGQIGEIYLAYTHFKNTVVHVPTLMKLLPVEVDEEDVETGRASNLLMNFEPNEEEALSLIIPKYLSSLVFGALTEAVASENGARMQAMDSATSNAEDMISDLTLKYNRARQGSITQELTEIIAGAEALT